MKSFLLILFVIGNSIASPSKTNKILTENQYKETHQELKLLYGKNKSFVDHLELAALVSLSYYPELAETRIKFKLTDTKTTMATRPAISSTLTKRANRVYVIYVDKKVKKNNGILAIDVPFNALVGLISHEFEHILEYEEMSMLQIVKLGLRYGNMEFKARFERDTDHRVIERGLGWQLMNWADYAMHSCNASKKYKTYKKDVYLSKDQIEDAMSNHKLYASYFMEDEILATK